jgi:hypothetical protein
MIAVASGGGSLSGFDGIESGSPFFVFTRFLQANRDSHRWKRLEWQMRR